MEQKYQMGTESGSLLWNIGKMLEDTATFRVVSRSTAELAEGNPFHGDPEYAMETDLSKPLSYRRENINSWTGTTGCTRPWPCRWTDCWFMSSRGKNTSDTLRIIRKKPTAKSWRTCSAGTDKTAPVFLWKTGAFCAIGAGKGRPCSVRQISQGIGAGRTQNLVELLLT